MSGGLPPVIGGGPPAPPTGPGLDCSGPAQDWRRWMLGNLLTKMYGGVTSLSDRGRSVNYYSQDDLQQLINNLRNEMALCENSAGSARLRGPRRAFHVPYSKWA